VHHGGGHSTLDGMGKLGFLDGGLDLATWLMRSDGVCVGL
jgi:hypothetical protein